MDESQVEDDNLESTLEALVKEYNKQDGIFLFFTLLQGSCILNISADAAMKVSEDVLQRVYHLFKEHGNKTNDHFADMLDPESHLHIVNAFDMPLWNWSVERGSFEKYGKLLKILKARSNSCLKSYRSPNYRRFA